jgi:hypothetical protein
MIELRLIETLPLVAETVGIAVLVHKARYPAYDRKFPAAVRAGISAILLRQPE